MSHQSHPGMTNTGGTTRATSHDRQSRDVKDTPSPRVLATAHTICACVVATLFWASAFSEPAWYWLRSGMAWLLGVLPPGDDVFNPTGGPFAASGPRRRTVVAHHAFGEPEATKYSRQMRAHRQREARVIVQHRQGVAAAAARHRDVAIEVHLPQLVGTRTLGSHERCRRTRGRRVDQIMAVQDPGDRARRRRAFEPALRQPRRGRRGRSSSGRPWRCNASHL